MEILEKSWQIWLLDGTLQKFNETKEILSSFLPVYQAKKKSLLQVQLFIFGWNLIEDMPIHASCNLELDYPKYIGERHCPCFSPMSPEVSVFQETASHYRTYIFLSKGSLW